MVKSMKQISLNHAISGQYQLTEEDITSLKQLLTSRCSPRTKGAVQAALWYIQEEKPYSIYDGIIKDSKSGSWRYIASQSYLDEIRTIRSLLRGW